MKRTAVNPWPWSLHYGFNQADLVEGQSRTLYCSGQTSLDKDGKPQHAGDMRGQIKQAFDNLETVLRGADMTLANVVRLVIYTTDVDSLLQGFDIVGSRLTSAGAVPAQTMLGVNRLFLPQLLVELEATAVA
jgi:enamine deaminase RidA (YjgF/YER057c/UK114 family)